VAPVRLFRHALVAVDVIRATTTAVTAVAAGRGCYPVTSVEAAWRVAAAVPDALLVGELGGVMPHGFHLNNSPADLAALDDHRPVVLLSSSGTQLMHEIRQNETAFAACFRNTSATIRRIAQCQLPAVVIGAATRGEFRDEDQMCCAWIASGLLGYGYAPADGETATLVERWQGASTRDFLGSPSVEYLRSSDQLRDLAFILDHFDDIEFACRIVGDRVLSDPSPAALSATS
jgi:2-phosphosulfolactate phosphatase